MAGLDYSNKTVQGAAYLWQVKRHDVGLPKISVLPVFYHTVNEGDEGHDDYEIMTSMDRTARETIVELVVLDGEKILRLL
ncbi:hypothetical protein BDW62DRAFT_203264 [Aspergillus aurantiobrunneus]